MSVSGRCEPGVNARAFTIMQEIMRSRATPNLHYGVRPRHEGAVKEHRGKSAYYGSKRTSEKISRRVKRTGKKHQ